jgi:ribosomal protein S18 acetylase RimI-like enzyme
MTKTRIAALADVTTLVELYSGFRDSLLRTTPTGEELNASLEKLVRAPDVRVFLATVEDRAVGYAAQRYFYSAWVSGEEALLEDLYVRSDCRGLGVGRCLVEHAIGDAKARGCRSLSLDTNENNAASNALYRHLGFKCERPRWSGGRQIRYDLSLA